MSHAFPSTRELAESDVGLAVAVIVTVVGMTLTLCALPLRDRLWRWYRRLTR
jgi:hypothetical protein